MLFSRFKNTKTYSTFLDFVWKLYAENIRFKFSYWYLIFKLRDSM